MTKSGFKLPQPPATASTAPPPRSPSPRSSTTKSMKKRWLGLATCTIFTMKGQRFAAFLKIWQLTICEQQILALMIPHQSPKVWLSRSALSRSQDPNPQWLQIYFACALTLGLLIPTDDFPVSYHFGILLAYILLGLALYLNINKIYNLGQRVQRAFEARCSIWSVHFCSNLAKKV